MFALDILIYFFLKLIYLCLIIFFLINIIKKRSSLKSVILYLVLLVIFITVGLTTYLDQKNKDNKASKNFLGDWKLEKLDRKNCGNCKIKLYQDYHYEIIVKNQVIDHGNWDLGFDHEEGGYYLIIYKDQGEMIWDQPRIIYNINKSDKL